MLYDDDPGADMTLEEWLRRHSTERDRAGLRRVLRPRAPDEPLIDLAGNDYLGLTTDPRVTDAAAGAALEWGAGAGASRLVTGSTRLHAELESALAQFTGRPACLVYSTGYLANLGAVTALSDPGTLIVSDAHVHASLVDACRLARRARLHVNGHNDIDDVARALRDRAEPRAMVLCESVYSVLGDPAPLAELVQVTQEYDAVLVVDEAHAIGVAGPGGRGMLAGVVGSGGGTPAGVAASGGTPAGVEGSGGTSTGVGSRDDPAHVVTTLTLSKALGAQGGAVLGSVAVTEHLINTSRAFIYDTGLAPAAAAAALRAVELVRSDPGLPARALHLARRLSHGLGLPTPAGAVLSVPMAGPGEAVAAQARLREAGFLVGCFRPPSVPDGVSRLRLTAKASLTDGDVDKVLVELAALIGDR